MLGMFVICRQNCKFIVKMFSFVKITFNYKIGCRGASSDEPLATNCNACRYVKNAVTGECLEKCPEGWEKQDDNSCRRKIHVA